MFSPNGRDLQDPITPVGRKKRPMKHRTRLPSTFPFIYSENARIIPPQWYFAWEIVAAITTRVPSTNLSNCLFAACIKFPDSPSLPLE